MSVWLQMLELNFSVFRKEASDSITFFSAGWIYHAKTETRQAPPAKESRGRRLEVLAWRKVGSSLAHLKPIVTIHFNTEMYRPPTLQMYPHTWTRSCDEPTSLPSPTWPCPLPHHSTVPAMLESRFQAKVSDKLTP